MLHQDEVTEMQQYILSHTNGEKFFAHVYQHIQKEKEAAAKEAYHKGYRDSTQHWAFWKNEKLKAAEAKIRELREELAKTKQEWNDQWLLEDQEDKELAEEIVKQIGGPVEKTSDVVMQLLANGLKGVR